MEHQLQIRHEKDGEHSFRIVRPSDGKHTEPVALDSPASIVEGRPLSNLQKDIRWYLENFLELPMEPDIAKSERILTAMETWGSDCFEKLLKNQPWYEDARQAGLENLRLKIASESPEILSWPWEALRDSREGPLAQRCRIERQLVELNDPLPLPANLPVDRINILLVIARPYGDQDVGLHALSRPMLKSIREMNLPVAIYSVRPPTFEQLRKMLQERPGFYHIVHFDGHGGYADPKKEQLEMDRKFRGGAQGSLVFEDEINKPKPVDAETLSILLAEHRIPIMVLNACRSARIDDHAEDAYASVAAALLRAGIRSVVAMGFDLYVSGAQQFIPAFYQRLLKSGDVGEAVRAGRQAMLLNKDRPCFFGRIPLDDWLVPVLYQQLPANETVLPHLSAASKDDGKNDYQSLLPEEVNNLAHDDFIGRDSAVLELERACIRHSTLLIQGMAGIGKTTLAMGFVQWLADTNGLKMGVFWFNFSDISNVEYVINRMVEKLHGLNYCSQSMDARLNLLVKKFKEKPYLIVWDNFESVSGIAGTKVSPGLKDGDRQILKALLQRLQGGRTRILITSRSPEDWLEQPERLPLKGLRGEELWQYCNTLAQGKYLVIDRKRTGLPGFAGGFGRQSPRYPDGAVAVSRSENHRCTRGAEKDTQRLHRGQSHTGGVQDI